MPAKKPREGIPCPQCHREMGHDVLESRMVEGTVRRRRECGCGCRFVTTEVFSHVVAKRAHRGVRRGVFAQAAE